MTFSPPWMVTGVNYRPRAFSRPVTVTPTPVLSTRSSTFGLPMRCLEGSYSSRLRILLIDEMGQGPVPPPYEVPAPSPDDGAQSQDQKSHQYGRSRMREEFQ